MAARYQIKHDGTTRQTALQLTASKSESNRALIIQAACEGKFDIENLAAAKDTETMKRLLASEGSCLDVGPAGTTMRFLTAFLACSQAHKRTDDSIELTGSDRMKLRPIGLLVDSLRHLGADIQYGDMEGFPPLFISPRQLHGGRLTLDGSISSQFTSAVLLVSPLLPDGLTIDFSTKVISKPYLDMTMKIMNHFGANARWEDGSIVVGNTGYTARSFRVEGDWSAASYWYAVVALGDQISVEVMGLHKESLQGDAVLPEIFTQFGVTTAFTEQGIVLEKNGEPAEHFSYHFEGCPDLAQTVAVVAAGLGMPAELTGLETLRIKETDRITALQKELEKFKVAVRAEGDDKIILDGSVPALADGIVIETYEDHRMAMAFAPLALICPGLQVNDPDVVVKSYPDFWTDLRKAGFIIEEV